MGARGGCRGRRAQELEHYARAIGVADAVRKGLQTAAFSCDVLHDPTDGNTDNAWMSSVGNQLRKTAMDLRDLMQNLVDKLAPAASKPTAADAKQLTWLAIISK